MIALVSMGTMAQRETLRQFMEMGTDVISIQHEQRREDRASGAPSGFNLEDALKLPVQLASVRIVAPYASAFGEVRKEGRRQSVPALGVGVSMAVGIFFGFYPARQAAALNPIQAMRAE